MKLNVCTISFRHQLISFKKIALWAKNNDFKGIELWGVHAANMVDDLECDFSWLKSQNLNVSMISDYLVLEGDHQEAVEKAESLSRLCHYWGASKLRTFAGSKASEKITKQQRQDWVKRLKSLCNVVQNFGLYLIVETHPNSLADSLESTLQLIDEVNHPALRINFDVIHVWESGADPIRAVNTLSPFIEHLHLKNIAHRSLLNVFNPDNVYAPAGSREGMVNLFEGEYDFPKFLDALKNSRGSLWKSLDASLEWFGPSVIPTLEHDKQQLIMHGYSNKNFISKNDHSLISAV
ncbi:sugar phosphate isomerase/epimerase family protein [Marinagarivorans algicola]|uniref:sugar phosphate isomerase/epimerase family protein n=1 Tax=Marinagarivorans algicola TaxID=1513270 RepID=UPI0006B5633A|nr:sugar phosphate isomerase/epimerase family protein [Marinagarivorans algicola]